MKHWRIWNVVLLVVSIGITFLPASSRAQSTDIMWWLTGATHKVMTPAIPPDSNDVPISLHAARGEFAPFQVVFQGGDTGTQLSLDLEYDTSVLDVTVYREQFLPLPITPDPEIFTVARLRAEWLPDGVMPHEGTRFMIDNGVQETGVLWVDVF
jgi:hypothetical protein